MTPDEAHTFLSARCRLDGQSTDTYRDWLRDVLTTMVVTTDWSRMPHTELNWRTRLSVDLALHDGAFASDEDHITLFDEYAQTLTSVAAASDPETVEEEMVDLESYEETIAEVYRPYFEDSWDAVIAALLGP